MQLTTTSVQNYLEFISCCFSDRYLRQFESNLRTDLLVLLTKWDNMFVLESDAQIFQQKPVLKSCAQILSNLGFT